MITDTQLNMIRFELSEYSRAELEAKGVNNVISTLLSRYNLKKTAKNVNSIKILIEYKK